MGALPDRPQAIPMASKKKPAKSPRSTPKKQSKSRRTAPAKKTASRPKKAAKKSAPRPAPARARAAPSPPAAPAPNLPKTDSALAARMARFSKVVQREEAHPVAVRTFNEARAGVDEPKELDVRTGQVKPDVELEADVDAEPDEETEEETDEEPTMEPLAGPMAVPKREVEEFQIADPSRKKKSKPLTREAMGRIELRQQRGTGDMKVGEAKADYLQRSLENATEKGRLTRTQDDRMKQLAEGVDKFEVQFQTRSGSKPPQEATRGPVDPKLLDFGNVEIAQQTRKGARKVGELKKRKDDDEEE